MGPELLSPQQFGLKDSRPTKRSDCYALGMVVYEVLSGHIPFHLDADLVVFGRVVEGKRPGRPQGIEGAWFTDGVWELLERCWARQPDGRPRIGDALQSLEEISRSWTPPLPGAAVHPPTTNLPTRGSPGSSTEESTDRSEEPSPSRAHSSQPPQKLPPRGNPDKSDTRTSTEEFLPLSHGVSDMVGGIGPFDGLWY